MKFLANENFPLDAVEAVRKIGTPEEPFFFQRPRTRLESQGTHDHYDDARLWSTVSCECEDG